MPCASINIPGVGSRYTGCHGGANFSGRNTGYFNAAATADSWRGVGRNSGGTASCPTPAAPPPPSFADSVAKHAPTGTVCLSQLRQLVAECGVTAAAALTEQQRADLSQALSGRTLTPSALAIKEQVVGGSVASLQRLLDPATALSEDLSAARATGRGISKPELKGILARFEVKTDVTQQAPSYALTALRALGPETFASKQAKALADGVT